MKRNLIKKYAIVLAVSIGLSVVPAGVEVLNVSAETVLPAAYDARDYGYITPKKNQYGGTCWAFASIAAAEASLVKSGLADNSIDLSEFHTAYYSYEKFQDPLGNANDDYGTGTNVYTILNTGGSSLIAAEQFAKWSGPVPEAAMPYSFDEYLNGCSAGHWAEPKTDLSAESVLHLKKAVGASDEEDVKKLVLQYGAVTTGFYAGNDVYYNYDHEEITYHIPNVKVPNHAACIIGWDDNYPKEYFNYQPERNGAWLIKDSENFPMPYTWISYDTSMVYGGTFEFEPAELLDYNYQYDGCSVTTDQSFVGVAGTSRVKSEKCMNVYQAKRSQKTLEKVEAVMLHGFKNETYHIQIYVNPVITDGELTGYEYVSKPFDYTFEYDGICKVDVPETIYLNEGDSFGIEISGNRIADYPISIDSVAGRENIQKGESYVGKIEDGIFSYADLADYGTNGSLTGNLRIKGFTNATDIPLSGEVTIDITKKSIRAGEKFSISGSVQVPEGAKGGISFSSSDPKTVSVDANGNVTGWKVGKATIYAKATYGTGVAECHVEVVPTPATSLTMESSVSLKTQSIMRTFLPEGCMTPVTQHSINTDVSSYTYQLNPVINEEATCKDVVYESSNQNIAKVDSTGKITASKENPGTVVITAKTTDGSNLSATCTVTVTQAYAPDHMYSVIQNPNTAGNNQVTGPENTISVTTIPEVTTPKPEVLTEKQDSIKTGTVFTSKKLRYAVMSKDEVEVTGTTNNKIAALKIPVTVKYKGQTFKVTGIDKMAFSGLKKLKSVTISKNIKRIETKAFYGCKKLKKIKIASTSIWHVGKNAFKGISASAEITVPKKRYSDYKKKVFQDAGFGKKVSWKKK